MTAALSLADWLRLAAQRLAVAPGWQAPGLADVSPRREAEWLLCAVLDRDLAWLLTWPDKVLAGEELARAEGWLARRCAGEPLAYLAGRRDFWSLPLRVTPATLVPRPDTERLVELALERLTEDGSALDLGTGSGAIALALASERPCARITALDRSAEALAVARSNGEVLGLPVRWLESDWFAAVAGERYALIVSNPPYIAEDDPHLASLGREPLSALVAGESGLADLRHLVAEAPAHLLAGGWLLLEHGHAQADAVRALLALRGFGAVQSWQDLGGQDRVTGGQWPGNMAEAGGTLPAPEGLSC